MKLTNIQIRENSDPFAEPELNDSQKLAHYRHIIDVLKGRSERTRFDYRRYQKMPGVHMWKLPKTVDPKDYQEVKELNLFVAKNSPHFNELIQRGKKSRFQRLKLARAKRAFKLAKTAFDSKTMAQKKASAVNPPMPQTIPQRIPIKASATPGARKGNVKNPYFFSSKDQFYGHPGNAPHWNPRDLKQFTDLDDLLTRNGKQGFDRMYASRGAYTNKWSQALHLLHNHALIGANGDFVWIVKDPPAGAKQNVVYIAGNKMPTSTFLAKSAVSQDNLVQALPNKTIQAV